MKIEQKKLNKWAKILLDHSLQGVKKGDIVLIGGELAAWPLISTLQDKILKAGGMADISLRPPDNERGRVWGAAVARLGRMSNLATAPRWQRLRNETANKFIEILGMEHPELSRSPAGPLLKRILQLDSELRDICRKKKWVVTMYPTRAFASLEGLPFNRYSGVVLKGSTEPLSKTRSCAQRLISRLSGTKMITVVTRAPRSSRVLNLRIGVAGRRILTDLSGLNIPQGEVFTSPDANSVEGEIFLDMPILAQGAVIRGIYLKFSGGRVVSSRAEKGGEILSEMLNADSGARRLGEVAFGINSGLDVPLKHPLFCEKLAGTMHIAVGKCFPQAFVADQTTKKGKAAFKNFVRSGAANTSVRHMDLVVSFRKGGAGKGVFLDGRELKLRNGNWAS